MKGADEPSSAFLQRIPRQPATWLDDDLAYLREQNLYREPFHVKSNSGVQVIIGKRELLSFASNNYLDLASDPRLARSASRAARRYGCGAGSSPLVSGYLPPHRTLERALARWEGVERVLVFSSGFAANLSVISTIAEREDAIFSDELNHASLIDGCRLSRAQTHVYRHCDIDHLGELVKEFGPSARRRLIVTDTLFSMDGDLAPLADLVELARRHDAMLLIDEAHATGVIGTNGRGASETLPDSVRDDPERVIKVGTLSKALGAQGGFVCGSDRLVAWLVNRARPYIFSTALAPPIAAAARTAVMLVKKEPERRQHVLHLSKLVRQHLQASGYGTGRFITHIIPIVIGEARQAVEISFRLRELGIWVPAIRPPSVPVGTARLRISLTAGHSEADILRLVEALHATLPRQTTEWARSC